jgi:hypothetical protein
LPWEPKTKLKKSKKILRGIDTTTLTLNSAEHGKIDTTPF